MTLTQLTSFVEVARTLSFRRAAERLHLAQPSVSAHIRELERELGAQLFERLGRRVRLTHAGEVLLAHAERTLRDVDEARAAVGALSETPRGLLSIGVAPSLVATLMPQVVRRVQLDAPEVTWRLDTVVSETVLLGVRRGDYDLGVAYFTRADPAIATTTLMEDEFILVAGSAHPLTKRGPIKARDLEGMPLIGFEEDTAGRMMMDRELGRRGIRPDIFMELSSSEAIKGMVAAAVGAAIVSRMVVARELEQGIVRQVPLSDLTLRHPVVALTRARQTPSAPLRVALAALENVATQLTALSADQRPRVTRPDMPRARPRWPAG